MTAGQHALYEELAAGYALSALEPDEEHQFLRHLAACTRCELELAEHRAIASQLAYAVQDELPPASLLAGIRAGMGLQAEVGSQHEPGGPADGLPANVIPLRRRLRTARSGAWLAAAAAAVLVVSLGVSNLALRSDRDVAQDASVRLRAAVTQIVNSRTVQLRAPSGEVRAVALISDERVSLVLDGMARNDETSSTYVLWRKTKYGAPTAVGVFDVRDNKVDVIRNLPLKNTEGLTALAITLERGRVAPATASAPLVAVGQLS